MILFMINCHSKDVLQNKIDVISYYPAVLSKSTCNCQKY